jgi:predicted nucleic acid-binding protein
MITAVHTNILVALWDRDPDLSLAAQVALDTALGRGGLVISAPVFAELLACPGRDEAFVDIFLQDTGIAVEWELYESVWRTAGRAFQSYATRRRKHADAGPRRILADFVIGAHALEKGFELLTLDDRMYRAAFPGLRIGKV